MSEEKNDKPTKTDSPAPEKIPQKSRKGIFPFIVIVAIVVLLVLVVMGFLNGQKLNQQVVVLERRLATLQQEGHKTEGRLQSLAAELAARTLQQQRQRIRRAQRVLSDLKPALKANPGLTAKVGKLVEELKQESRKLGRKLHAQSPAAAVSRPCRNGHPSPSGSCPWEVMEEARPATPAAASHAECANGICRLVPEKPAADKEYAVALPGADSSLPSPAVVENRPAAASVETLSEAGSGSSRKQPPRNWWSRFISLRIFGGN